MGDPFLYRNNSEDSCVKAVTAVAVVGTIVGASGYTGNLKVKPQTDNPERFLPGKSLIADGKSMKIEASYWRNDLVILKFNDIDTNVHAKGFYGMELTVALDDVPALADDNYYYFQILGIEVRTMDGEILGNVQEIIETGSNDVYVINGEGGELLIPALSNIILSVDLEIGLMTVSLPPGLR